MNEVSSKEDVVVTYLTIKVGEAGFLDSNVHPSFELAKHKLKLSEIHTLKHCESVYIEAGWIGGVNKYFKNYLADVNIAEYLTPPCKNQVHQTEVCAVVQGTEDEVQKLTAFFDHCGMKDTFRLCYREGNNRSVSWLWANNRADCSMEVRKSEVFYMPGRVQGDTPARSYYCKGNDLYGLFGNQSFDTGTLLQRNSRSCASKDENSGKLHNVFTVHIYHPAGEKPCLVFEQRPYHPPLEEKFLDKEGLYIDFLSYQEHHTELIEACKNNPLVELDSRPQPDRLMRGLLKVRIWALLDSGQDHESVAYLKSFLNEYNPKWKADGGEEYTFDIKVRTGDTYIRTEVNTKRQKTLLLNSYEWFTLKQESEKPAALVFDENPTRTEIQIAVETQHVLNDVVAEVKANLKASKAVPSIIGKLVTQDVVVGFDAYEDLGIGVSRSKGLKLTLKIEKRDGIPSLRQSNLFITTAKAKGYGPVFIVDAEVAADLNSALEEFYKRSGPDKPVFGFTDVITSQEAKPVNTPLGKLFEAQLTFAGEDNSRVAKFFDFGVKDLEA